jgi:hypothetical protein
VTPAIPTHTQAFTVYCWVVIPMGPSTTVPALQINLAEVPGPGYSATLQPMVKNGTITTFWSYLVPATGGSVLTAYSFDVSIVATDRLGQQTVLVVPVQVIG